MTQMKKGKKGIAPNYITRNKAIKKLQVTLKDFRRLCILKGIYPREPQKKMAKNKTYYHKKDIIFLSHEPLLDKFRQIKTFIKKYTKLMARKEFTKAKKLSQHKPILKMDHLVKERYPSILDALRDLDDALTMISLFALIPAKVTKHFTGEQAQDCMRLSREFQYYVARTHALRKTFVSIKGTYYQAEIMGQTITWLVPHAFSQQLPRDVDYRVMVTFLDFYMVVLRFVLHHLYFHQGLQYPPIIDDTAEASSGLYNVVALPLHTGAVPRAPTASSSSSSSSAAAADAPKVDISSVLNKLRKAPADQQEDEQAMDTAQSGDAVDDDDEQLASLSNMVNKAGPEGPAEADGETKAAQEKAAEVPKGVFAGLTFLLGRECPQDALEFVIAAGGGVCKRQQLSTEAQLQAMKFSHQVIDRPTVAALVAGREYVQPQWVFDCFNTHALLPTQPYAPGAPLPPHLSPFVDDEAVGYIPQQREVLLKWGAEANAKTTPAAATEETKETAMEEDEDEAEARYEEELAKERSGITFSAATKSKADDEDEDDDDVEDDDEEEKDDDEADSSDEEDEEAAQPAKAAKPEPVPTGKAQKRKAADDTTELAKMVMDKKSKRLYSRMQHGIRKQEEANEVLRAKRRRIEQGYVPAAADSGEDEPLQEEVDDLQGMADMEVPEEEPAVKSRSHSGKKAVAPAAAAAPAKAKGAAKGSAENGKGKKQAQASSAPAAEVAKPKAAAKAAAKPTAEDVPAVKAAAKAAPQPAKVAAAKAPVATKASAAAAPAATKKGVSPTPTPRGNAPAQQKATKAPVEKSSKAPAAAKPASAAAAKPNGQKAKKGK